MNIQDFNFVVAASILVLAAVVTFDVWRTARKPATRFLALVAVVLGAVGVTTALAPALPGTVDIETIRFVAAAFRSVALIFLLGLLWHLVSDRSL
jgi:hypothetical protein